MNPSLLSLNEVQQAFQSAVMHLERLTPDFIIDTAQASSSERFKVYTDAYRLRLIEALRADYKTLEEYLGEEDFDKLARAYIDVIPSNQFSIRWFGRHLPAFLVNRPPYKDQQIVNELSIFEWALSEAFDAPESPSADYHQLASIDGNDWPSLSLIFHPSLRRIDLKSNAAQLWQASSLKTPFPEFTTVSKPVAWIVWRQNLKVLFRSISNEEAFALDSFRQKLCFAEVCTGLTEYLNSEEVVMKAASFLKTWLRDGLISDVEVT